MNPLIKRAAAAALLLCSGVTAQEETTTTTPFTTFTTPFTATSASSSPCATVLTPAYSAPVVAKGWKAQLIATGLSNPRGIKFDTNGSLLVLEQGVGLRHLTFNDNGGTCLSVNGNTSVITDEEVSSRGSCPSTQHGS
jgi:glucose/arabinose dehydrogenase